MEDIFREAKRELKKMKEREAAGCRNKEEESDIKKVMMKTDNVLEMKIGFDHQICQTDDDAYLLTHYKMERHQQLITKATILRKAKVGYKIKIICVLFISLLVGLHAVETDDIQSTETQYKSHNKIIWLQLKPWRIALIVVAAVVLVCIVVLCFNYFGCFSGWYKRRGLTISIPV